MSAQEKNTIIDLLPLVMFMLSVTIFPWRIEYPPPKCSEIDEEVVVLGQHGFFKDSRAFVTAYKDGLLWGKIILWPGSPIKTVTGTVTLKSYVYKNNRSEFVVFPASLTQGDKKYLTCGDYGKYVSDWWSGVYQSIVLVVLLVISGFVSGFVWLRRIRTNVIKK